MSITGQAHLSLIQPHALCKQIWQYKNYLAHISSIILLYLRPWENAGLSCRYYHYEIILYTCFDGKHDYFLFQTQLFCCVCSNISLWGRICLKWEFPWVKSKNKNWKIISSWRLKTSTRNALNFQLESILQAY